MKKTKKFYFYPKCFDEHFFQQIIKGLDNIYIFNGKFMNKSSIEKEKKIM